ncbi:MAG TPA: hypothetical protein VFJ06_04120 [Halococcus sp.]|nr:hypothetical protein [Halococcus sp.]
MTTVTEDDIGKPIFSAQENKIGTLCGIDGPTIYLRIADDIDTSLRGSMKVAETTAITDNGENYASATMASVSDITDDEIHFWPAYATEAEHESVDYEDIPAEDSHSEEF